jgi:hypothetical protein
MADRTPSGDLTVRPPYPFGIAEHDIDGTALVVGRAPVTVLAQIPARSERSSPGRGGLDTRRRGGGHASGRRGCLRSGWRPAV